MAPALAPRVPSAEALHYLSHSITSSLSKLSARDAASSTQPLTSIIALIITPSSNSIARRAITSLSNLPSQSATTIAVRSPAIIQETSSHILKRQSAILAIPTTYKGLNSGPAPGAVVGITLGSVGGFILCLYILLLSFQFYPGRSTVVKEEVIVKRHSSRSRRRSSHHSEPPPPSPPPARSRRETVIEVEETIRRSSTRIPSPDPEEVIVEEEETVSDEIVEVIEEQSSLASSHPPPRKPSAASGRRSGFRTVDPAEFGGGNSRVRGLNRRSSGR